MLGEPFPLPPNNTMSAIHDNIQFEDPSPSLKRDEFGRVLGLRRDLENKADLIRNQFQGRVMLGEIDYNKLPESMKIRDWMKIENQQNQGSCQGHAQSSACELSGYFATGGKIFQYSRQFCYLATQRIDGIGGDSGSTMSGGAKSASTYGLPYESDFPYLGGYPRGGWKVIPAAVWEKAKETRLHTYRVLKNYEEVIAWLAGKVGGVVWGIDWNRLCEPDSSGRIERVTSGGGGHALALLDWNKKFVDDKGRPYLSQFNSWGTNWGVGGVSYINPNVVDWHCRNNDVIGFAELVGKDITPRNFDWQKQSFFHQPVTAV